MSSSSDHDGVQSSEELVDRLRAVSALGSVPGDPENVSPEIDLVERLAERSSTTPRYVEKGEIARGGMGRILEVWDEDLRRTLAMKTMHTEAGFDVGRLGRFLEESQVTAQIDHPGVPPVHELGIDAQGVVYFTMQKVRGQDLQHILRLVDEGREGWSLTRAVGVLQRVCETMAFAHTKNVVHRDLKPANVMVGAFGETYVMDWGLAKVTTTEGSVTDDDLPPVRTDRSDWSDVDVEFRDHLLQSGQLPGALFTQEGAVLGTPSYMAPEQALGNVDQIGPHSDVYSVGAMLYALLTGGAPYAPVGSLREPADIVMDVRNGPPPVVHRLAPDVPAELAAICDKAMAREVEHRYPDMMSMAEDLRAYLENRVVTAHRTGAWIEFRKWVQRNRATAAALVAVLVAVLSGAGGVSYVSEKGKRTAETERDRYRGLSDIKRMREQLLLEQEELWPPRPELVAEFDDWLAGSEELLRHRDVHAENLASIEERGFAPDAAPTDALPGGRDDLLFTSGEDRYEHEVLIELLGQLERLPSVYERVSARRAFADEVRERTVTGEDAQRHWAEARDDIASSDVYGFDLPPQQGLLPLGEDPESGLWEFWHLQSGAEPKRDEQGVYRLGPETGIVLVLLPGGPVTVGSIVPTAENQGEPYADRYRVPKVDDDEGMHDVFLREFFLSKYELTQAQWGRVMESNPSDREGALHPVENVTGFEARTVISRMALVLPTEVQWEYACRAGTTTMFSTPIERGQKEYLSLQGYANLADRTLMAAGSDGHELIDDGFHAHAPVATFLPNPFGFYDMHGNVWEWCRDDYDGDAAPRDGDGLRAGGNDADEGSLRGGSWSCLANNLRSANRFRWGRTARDEDIGVRPARAIER